MIQFANTTTIEEHGGLGRRRNSTMTQCNLTKTSVIALLFCLGVRANGPLIQAVDQVIGLCNTSQWCAGVNVDDTGFDKEIYDNSLFSLSVLRT